MFKSNFIGCKNEKLKLLADMKTSSAFVNHFDVNLQRDVLNCLDKIGGPKRDMSWVRFLINDIFSQ